MESLMSLRLSGSGPRSRAAINLQVPSYFFKISYYYFDFFLAERLECWHRKMACDRICVTAHAIVMNRKPFRAFIPNNCLTNESN